MRSQAVVGATILVLSALGACRNSCQQICGEMADYAEECGLTVSDAQLQECYAAQKGSASSEDRAICREFGDPETLRAEWSCEDLEDYFDATGGGGDTDDTDA